MKGNKPFVVLTALGLVSFVGLMCFWGQLPEEIPIHWNNAGEIDGYGGKGMLVFLGLLPVGLAAMMWVVPKIDPKRKNYQKHQGLYFFLMAAMTLLTIVLGWMTLFAALGVAVPVERVVPGFIGATIMVLGNYMARIRPNYTFGIKTPWTLASETVWRKTHRMSGFWFTAGGFLMLLAAVFGSFIWLAVGVLLGGILFSYAYSWRLWRKEEREKGADNEKEG